jgi:protein-tyrosine kinase
MSRTYDAFRRTARGRAGKAPHRDVASMLEPVSPDGEPYQIPSIALDPSPDVEEKYQRLRGNLLAGDNRGQLKTLLLVGSVHGEGVTTTATMLASALSTSSRSKVLLVDANLRTPSLAKVFNIGGDSRGVTDLLISDGALDEFIRPTHQPNLFVLCAGRALRAPAYLFAEEGVERLLRALRARYDAVVVDGAPLRDYSDSVFLAGKVDGAILVIEAEKTPIDTVQASRRQLERSGARILGTVLNKKRNYIPRWVERFL